MVRSEIEHKPETILEYCELLCYSHKPECSNICMLP